MGGGGLEGGFREGRMGGGVLWEGQLGGGGPGGVIWGVGGGGGRLPLPLLAVKAVPIEFTPIDGGLMVTVYHRRCSLLAMTGDSLNTV